MPDTLDQITLTGAGRREAVSDTTTPLAFYEDLYALYNRCNAVFFADTLPACMIVLRPKKRVFGYFRPACWGRLEDSAGTVDSIALNTAIFRDHSEEELLSTLVHEMTHLWQEHYGEKKPETTIGHNREWGVKMTQHGLIPSTTGKPGGKQTGRNVAEYRLEGGLFARFYAEVQHEGTPLFRWAEFPKLVLAKQQPKKFKYLCPRCTAKAWAHKGTALACGDCREPMITEAVQVPLIVTRELVNMGTEAAAQRPVPDMTV